MFSKLQTKLLTILLKSNFLNLHYLIFPCLIHVTLINELFMAEGVIEYLRTHVDVCALKW